MLIRVPFTSETEKATVRAEQFALGRVMRFEGTDRFGTFFVFDDDPAEMAYAAGVKNDPVLQALASASFGQIDSWVDANITTLASARELLKKMLMVMGYLLKKSREI